MRRYGIPLLIAAAAVAGCSPSYISGKTQCSSKKECPSGFSCSDDGTSGTHYCVDNKTIRIDGCPSSSTFYCSQSDTCWAKPGACSTVTYCGTAKHPGSVICAQPNYHPDCNGDSCLPNGTIGDAGPGVGGAIGTGGATARGGAGGTTIVVTGSGGRTGAGGTVGYGGAKGYGGTIGYGGSIGAGGIRDAGLEVAPGLDGSYLTGGTGRGGTVGSGGYYLSGGTGGGGIYGTGGGYGSGGSTGSSLCSGALDCTSYTSGGSCIYNGCTWSGTMTCNATPVTPYCASLVTPSSDTCDVCIAGSCCTQLTNCLNDEICSTDFSGSLWDAYIECLINCCGSATFCNWY